jgi:hypothetical protein
LAEELLQQSLSSFAATLPEFVAHPPSTTRPEMATTRPRGSRGAPVQSQRPPVPLAMVPTAGLKSFLSFRADLADFASEYLHAAPVPVTAEAGPFSASLLASAPVSPQAPLVSFPAPSQLKSAAVAPRTSLNATLRPMDSDIDPGPFLGWSDAEYD